MNIKTFAQIFFAHGSTFGVPAREPFAPWRWPMHYMFWLCLFPQRKVKARPFFILAVKIAGICQEVFHFSARKLTILKIFGIFFNIKINRAFALISISVVKNLLYQFNLLNYMSRGSRFNARWQNIELSHIASITIGICLNNFHWFKLVELSLLCNFVFTFISIVHKVPNVGNISNVANSVT